MFVRFMQAECVEVCTFSLGGLLCEYTAVHSSIQLLRDLVLFPVWGCCENGCCEHCSYEYMSVVCTAHIVLGMYLLVLGHVCIICSN